MIDPHGAVFPVPMIELPNDDGFTEVRNTGLTQRDYIALQFAKRDKYSTLTAKDAYIAADEFITESKKPPDWDKPVNREGLLALGFNVNPTDNVFTKTLFENADNKVLYLVVLLTGHWNIYAGTTQHIKMGRFKNMHDVREFLRIVL